MSGSLLPYKNHYFKKYIKTLLLENNRFQDLSVLGKHFEVSIVEENIDYQLIKGKDDILLISLPEIRTCPSYIVNALKCLLNRIYSHRKFL